MITKSKKIKKRRIQNLLFPAFLLFTVMAIASLFIYSNWRISQRRAEQLRRIDELKKEIQEVEQKNEQLKSGISAAGTQEYWEEKAREQGYKKPGEEQVTIVPLEGEKTETKTVEKTFWQKVLEKIGL